MKTYYEIPGTRDFYSTKVGVVEIDPDIAEAVRIFNEKGYETIASCAGHADKRRGFKAIHGYIWMKAYPREKLPKGIFKDGHSSSQALRWKPLTENGLASVHKSLLAYAKRIKPNKDKQ